MPGKKILIIDDSPHIQGPLKDLFESEGYEVFAASDIKDGLSKARQLRPDLVFLDVMIPSGSGLGIYDQLKKIKGDAPTHVLVYSSAPSFLIEGKAPGLDKADI